MGTRNKPLYRTEIRQKTDRPTSSVILQYVGDRLRFDAEIYGYPEGTFFVASHSDVPWPEDLEDAAAEAGVAVESIPDALDIRDAAIQAIVTQAMVEAPELLEDMAQPRVHWNDWDRRELERRHLIAVRRLEQLTSVAVRQTKLRACSVSVPLERPALPDMMPPLAGHEMMMLPGRGQCDEIPDSPAISDSDTPAAPAASYDRIPTSVAVHKAKDATVAAREAELPQRLPGGDRRRIRQLPPGVYISHAGALDPRADLSAAMADAQSGATEEHESVVIDWDGEWPVVVRRYGKDGRTVYKVEDALRRAGIDSSEVQEQL